MKKENWFKDFYNTLINVGQKLSKADNRGKLIIIRDLLILIVVVCALKIPFIFIRDVFDNVLNVFTPQNNAIFVILGLAIEILYIIVALLFFKRTLKRYLNKESK